MSAEIQLAKALGELDGRLKKLNAMVVANQFLMDALREYEDALKSMEPEATRAMLRKTARILYGPDNLKDANPEVLEILEEILAPRHSAEIIAFPGNSTVH